MKKILSIVAVISILVVGLFFLTGCGSNDLKDEKGKEATQKNEDVVIATKTEEEDGMQIKTKIEVTFKDDIVTKATTSMEFDSEETASLMYQFLGSEEGATLSGKTITMKDVTPTEDDEDVTKQDFIDEMTSQGYTIQK